jgi:alcohol dehydrogenase class IV
VLSEFGLVERVNTALNVAGVECLVFDGVEPDPRFA